MLLQFLHVDPDRGVMVLIVGVRVSTLLLLEKDLLFLLSRHVLANAPGFKSFLVHLCSAMVSTKALISVYLTLR
jgi:hypothetical protein